MNNNYNNMQEFLDIVKEFAISNPNNIITEKFIYSLLIKYRTSNPYGQSVRIDDNFEYWKNEYHYNNKISVFEHPDLRGFLFFDHGNLSGNEVKLYIPLDKEHVKDGAKQLFDFISKTGIAHQSKIARIIRNDNVVVRVNNLEDAKIIMDYVNQNGYLKSGMLQVNPFLPNYNGVGITMDNNFSFNSEVSRIISDFIEDLKRKNRIDLCNIENLNNYIQMKSNEVQDLDLKDIYNLLGKTTSKNFKIEDFWQHANYKLIDKYEDNRGRITDPNYYLEQAIITTEKFYPGNSKAAIKNYLKSEPNYFTNKERVREGLLKYVRPADLINLMRQKLREKNIQIPMHDENLINEYLNIVLNKQNNYSYQFEIIKMAYINTLSVYGEMQALEAFKSLYFSNNIKYFTNKFGDREQLKKIVPQCDVRKIILSNINTSNLDVNDTNEIYNRFVEILNQNYEIKKGY